ncbi:uncharacterized protein LOC115884693 [Sitophilus oryzae]|uniref:Uncharacterized protein LOC115884693 n=1 Tax=Sitophilus oryzae TaxID=7048 RepID=A0A6J2Y6F6_SITOR|nr:uncharacterized protein LOC115884693 [Sitophilus oryzae]XP_030759203.1 uncharacterized protein LOC115884693 [Sitophilus oryzae]
MDIDIDISTLEIKENERKRNHSELSPSSSSTSNSLHQDESKQNDLNPRRSLRKRIRPLEPTIENCRVLRNPRKLSINSTMKDVQNYYLDKRIKLNSQALETIFEEPQKELYMSSKKLRRCINFINVSHEKPNKAKVKKRVLKAKKTNNFKKVVKKIDMDLLLSKLAVLDNANESED